MCVVSAFVSGMSYLSLLIIKVIGDVSGFCDELPSDSMNDGAEFEFLPKM
jgi:hypothetical protein